MEAVATASACIYEATCMLNSTKLLHSAPYTLRLLPERATSAASAKAESNRASMFILARHSRKTARGQAASTSRLQPVLTSGSFALSANSVSDLLFNLTMKIIIIN